MSTLAHVFEAEGLATVSLISVRGVAEKMSPPRALYCDFPLGRPLGEPQDAQFQHDVLRAAFVTLDEPTGPVLVDYPVVIEIDDATPLSCAVPPRYDMSLHPAVDEITALRGAYNRTLSRNGVTSVGRSCDADGLPDVMAKLVEIIAGADWKEVGLPGNPVGLAHDLRTYYEEAALALNDEPPAPGAAESWFYDVTQGGRTLLEARRAMRDGGAPFPVWFYMARATRQ